MFSALIASGLKGIEEQYDLPAPIDLDEKITSRGDIQRLGLQPVPSNLSEALKHLDQSALMRETLGNFIVDTFIENKMIEIEKYNSFITDYEIR
jgi:glutamine synthetase